MNILYKKTLLTALEVTTESKEGNLTRMYGLSYKLR